MELLINQIQFFRNFRDTIMTAWFIMPSNTEKQAWLIVRLSLGLLTIAKQYVNARSIIVLWHLELNNTEPLILKDS